MDFSAKSKIRIDDKCESVVNDDILLGTDINKNNVHLTGSVDENVMKSEDLAVTDKASKKFDEDAENKFDAKKIKCESVNQKENVEIKEEEKSTGDCLSENRYVSKENEQLKSSSIISTAEVIVENKEKEEKSSTDCVNEKQNLSKENDQLKYPSTVVVTDSIIHEENVENKENFSSDCLNEDRNISQENEQLESSSMKTTTNDTIHDFVTFADEENELRPLSDCVIENRNLSEKNEILKDPSITSTTDDTSSNKCLIHDIDKNVDLTLSQSSDGVPARVQFIKNYLTPKESEELYASLVKDLKWEQKESVKSNGGKYPEPRLTYWFGKAYKYSSVSWAENNEWHPQLESLRHALSVDDKFSPEPERELNSVMCNYYRDNRDSIGWHSDDEVSLGRCPKIASISLGCTRMFDVCKREEYFSRFNKPVTDKSTFTGCTEMYRFHLNSGSLLLMEGSVQDDWVHRVPTDDNDMAGRINLTFRFIVGEEEEKKEIERKKLQARLRRTKNESYNNGNRRRYGDYQDEYYYESYKPRRFVNGWENGYRYQDDRYYRKDRGYQSWPNNNGWYHDDRDSMVYHRQENGRDIKRGDNGQGYKGERNDNSGTSDKRRGNGGDRKDETGRGDSRQGNNRESNDETRRGDSRQGNNRDRNDLNRPPRMEHRNDNPTSDNLSKAESGVDKNQSRQNVNRSEVGSRGRSDHAYYENEQPYHRDKNYNEPPHSRGRNGNGGRYNNDAALNRGGNNGGQSYKRDGNQQHSNEGGSYSGQGNYPSRDHKRSSYNPDDRHQNDLDRPYSHGDNNHNRAGGVAERGSHTRSKDDHGREDHIKTEQDQLERVAHSDYKKFSNRKNEHPK